MKALLLATTVALMLIGTAHATDEKDQYCPACREEIGKLPGPANVPTWANQDPLQKGSKVLTDEQIKSLKVEEVEKQPLIKSFEERWDEIVKALQEFGLKEGETVDELRKRLNVVPLPHPRPSQTEIERDKKYDNDTPPPQLRDMPSAPDSPRTLYNNPSGHAGATASVKLDLPETAKERLSKVPPATPIGSYWSGTRILTFPGLVEYYFQGYRKVDGAVFPGSPDQLCDIELFGIQPIFDHCGNGKEAEPFQTLPTQPLPPVQSFE